MLFSSSEIQTQILLSFCNKIYDVDAESNVREIIQTYLICHIAMGVQSFFKIFSGRVVIIISNLSSCQIFKSEMIKKKKVFYFFVNFGLLFEAQIVNRTDTMKIRNKDSTYMF